MAKANISGERIKQGRERRKLTQIDLAAALEVDFDIKLDRSDISEIETGIRGVKDYELKAIAEILDVSLDWLVCSGEADN